MKRLLTILILLVASVAHAAEPVAGLTVFVEVEKITDGDTLVVHLPGSAFRWKVRLLECWAPELKEQGGPESKAFATAAVKTAKRKLLHIPLPSKPNELLSGVTFDRVLGYVWLDGKNLSETMVTAGHATANRRKTK